MRKLVVVYLLLVLALLIYLAVPKERKVIVIAGSSTLYPLNLRWAEEYMRLHPDVSVEVSSGGSGFGIDAAGRGIVDIGASSHPLFPEQRERYPNLVELPVALDAVAVVANKHVNDSLRLTREMLVAIFSGAVKTWEELEQKFGVRIRATGEIHVYVRAEASGTTEVFTLWLSRSPNWTLGHGEVISWPERFVRAEGNYGIASAVRNDPNGIGYVGLAYITADFVVAAIENPSTGEFVAPSPETVRRAAEAGAETGEMFDAPVSGAYPIVRALYYVVNRERVRGRSYVLEFIRWVLTDGQIFVPEVGYVELTNTTLQTHALEVLSRLRGA